MVRWIDGCSCVATYHIYKHIVVGFFLFTCNALCGSLPWCKIFRCVPGSSESHFAAKSAAILPKPGSATHTSPFDMTTVRFLPQSPIQIRFSSGNKPWIFRVFRSFFFLKIMYHVASPFFFGFSVQHRCHAGKVETAEVAAQCQQAREPVGHDIVTKNGDN